MKTGLVVEGGGMRGIYSAGVLDQFLKMGLQFDYCVGASAGAANLATFLARQYKRNYRFYYEYGVEKEFLSFQSFLKKHQYFGLDYIYDDLATTSGKDPLDFHTMIQNPAELEFVITNARTGKAEYVSKEHAKLNDYGIIKASCCIPIACSMVNLNGKSYVDGGVGDPLPIKRAFEKGCDVVVVVLVRSWPRPIKKRRKWFYDVTLNRYPELKEAILTTDELHDEEDRLVFEYEKQGKVIVVMPKEDSKLTSTIQDQTILQEFYEQGINDAKEKEDVLRKYIRCESYQITSKPLIHLK